MSLLVLPVSMLVFDFVGSVCVKIVAAKGFQVESVAVDARERDRISWWGHWFARENRFVAASQASKNISLTSNYIKKKYSNTYLYFQNNQNQCSLKKQKQCSLDLDVVDHVYFDIPNILKSSTIIRTGDINSKQCWIKLNYLH